MFKNKSNLFLVLCFRQSHLFEALQNDAINCIIVYSVVVVVSTGNLGVE